MHRTAFITCSRNLANILPNFCSFPLVVLTMARWLEFSHLLGRFRNISVGDMHQPGSYSSSGGYGDIYEEDRYGGRDEERNGYGRDEEKYGRYGGDSYSRDGDRYGRGYDECSRDGNRDDDHRGRSRSVDDHSYDSRSRSSDRDRNRAYDDDGQYSSRFVFAPFCISKKALFFVT